METVLAIVVLLIILALLAGLVVVWARASGPGAMRAWLVAPAAVRETLGGLLVSDRDTTAPPETAAADCGADPVDVRCNNSHGTDSLIRRPWSRYTLLRSGTRPALTTGAPRSRYAPSSLLDQRDDWIDS